MLTDYAEGIHFKLRFIQDMITRSVEGHQAEIYGLEFSNDENYLVSNSYTLTRQIITPPTTLEWVKWVKPNDGSEAPVPRFYLFLFVLSPCAQRIAHGKKCDADIGEHRCP